MDKGLLETLLDTRLDDVRDNWRGICPFHFESTPSFFIHRNDLVGHCFGCGIAGPVDFLVAKHREISQEKARNLLGLSVQDLVKTERKVQKVQEIPQALLHGWKRLRSHPYLEARGFNEDTTITFQARWDGNASRIVFPHWASNEILLGAAGRTTKEDYPKWYFYWGYRKSIHLFTPPGFWESKYTYIIVCEGIFDVMRLWQAGYRNGVALLGSEPSKGQIRDIKQVTNKVVLALDNDDPGQKGAKILEKALISSCNVMYAPFTTNDIADLSENDIHTAMNTLITPVQRYAKY